MEANGNTVFGMSVNLILAAVENHSPNRAYAECVVGLTVYRGNEVWHILCVNASCIVVSARENYGARAARDCRSNFINCIEILNITAMIGNITIENEKINLVTKIATCAYGLVNKVMRVGDVIDINISIGWNGAEANGESTLFLTQWEVGATVDHFYVVNCIFTRFVEYLAGKLDLVHACVGAEYTVAIIVVCLIFNSHPHNDLIVKWNEDKVAFSCCHNRGITVHIFGKICVVHRSAPF